MAGASSPRRPRISDPEVCQDHASALDAWLTTPPLVVVLGVVVEVIGAAPAVPSVIPHVHVADHAVRVLLAVHQRVVGVKRPVALADSAVIEVLALPRWVEAASVVVLDREAWLALAADVREPGPREHWGLVNELCGVDTEPATVGQYAWPG